MPRVFVHFPEWLKIRAFTKAYQMGISFSAYLRALVTGDNPGHLAIKKIPYIKNLMDKRHGKEG